MENQAIISVVIPAYNAGAYINACLKSVVTQREASFEVIVVNDGSTDDTAEICKKWAGIYSNLVYIEQENQGQGTARNIAIRHAKGEWLVFLDADDMLLPGALAYLEKHASEEADIWIYGYIFVDRDQRRRQRQLPPDTDDKKIIMKETVSVLWDKMFRTEFWKKEGIQLLNTYGEDVCPVYLLEARAKKIRTVQISLMCHYDREDNLSSKPEQIIQIVETLLHTIQTFEEKGLFESYKTPLFFMILKHHKHYFGRWKINHQNEERIIMDGLGRIAMQYYPEKAQELFEVEKESLVIIGKINRPFPAELEARDVYYYSYMEQYLVDENKVTDTTCHFIINVENEIKSANAHTRTKEWALSYWKMQCIEMLEIKKNKKLKGKVFLYCSKTSENELVSYFEETAQNIWKCKRLEKLEDFWIYAKDNDKEIIETYLSSDKIYYRGEYLRQELNAALLCSWLRLKQQGIGLRRYFIEHKYAKIGIYGRGYLGELLSDELPDPEVRVLYFIDWRCSEKAAVYPVYSPDDILPAADVVVVSVLHYYDTVNIHLKCACPVISLEEVVDWCVKKSEEGNMEYVQ